MSAPEVPVPLSAVALRLTDEVGQAALDRIASGDLASAAELDQHVSAVRSEVAACGPDQPSAARVAGQAAARAGLPQPARPHHSRRMQAARSAAPVPSDGTAAGMTACPDVPFADNPWHADAPLAVGLLLHYACGFIETAVGADWWPANPAVGYQIEWQALRLAAVCRLIRHAEATAALPPGLR